MEMNRNGEERHDDDVLNCIVVHDHRYVSLSISVHDTVEHLLALARMKLRKKYPYEELDMEIVRLYSRRLGKDLILEASVDQMLEDGDTLEVRPHTNTFGTASVYNLNLADCNLPDVRSNPLSLSTLATTFGVSSKPGVFIVSAVRAEKLPVSTTLRFTRVSLGLRLYPYENEVAIAAANGCTLAWENPITLKHHDDTNKKLLICIQVYDDPSVGIKQLIGTAIIPLHAAVDSAGATVTNWFDIEKTNTSSDQSFGRLQVSFAFHPKVIKGPTLDRLLQTAQSEPHCIAHSHNTKSISRIVSSRVFQKKKRSKARKSLHQESNRRIKGQFRLSLHGIHICGSLCSKVNGHNSTSSPGFAPILSIKFDEFEHEIHVDSENCDTVQFDQEWPVYSSFSRVEILVLRKATLSTGTDHRLHDGAFAEKLSALTISCHDIQAHKAAMWTFDPPDLILGPGRRPPQPGYLWYQLRADDEEAGLVQLRVDYNEDLFEILSANESPDIYHLYEDEMEFDPATIQRNFERMDDLFKLLKSYQTWIAEIFDWKYPAQTITIWMAINISCIYLSIADLPLCVLTGTVVALLVNYAHFLLGYSHKRWIFEIPKHAQHKPFRPIATIRIVPVGANGLLERGVESSTHLDTFVRVYYESNYKNIPEYLIAQTECARQSSNPVWAIPQADGDGGKKFRMHNNNCLKASFKHLTPYEQSYILQDVVQPWSRPDGRVDTHAFMYPILQPVEVNKSTGEEELIEWRNCPSMLRFDVMQEHIGGQVKLFGRVRVSIKSLVSNEKLGGPQDEIEETFPIVNLTTTPTDFSNMSEMDTSDCEVAYLIVRIQLLLRDTNERVTLKEILTSEAMYGAIEMEHGRELSLVEKYHKAKDVAKNIQQALGHLCSLLERIQNLLLWVHPMKTLMLMMLLLLGTICIYLIPLQYIVMYVAAKQFTQKFHRIVDTDMVRFQNFLCTIPSNLDMRKNAAYYPKIYYRQNQDFLRAKAHTEVQAKLCAEWAGIVWKQYGGVFSTWQSRYCAVRSGRLEFWQSIADAKAGYPPQSCILVSNVVEKCSSTESIQVPKDGYPLAVYDVSRKFLAYSPKGKKKIICTKTETDFHALAEIIRRTGERL